MSYLRAFRLGLVHVAVAMTFVPINGVLNRIMIHEMQILASVVAALVILPYVLSPLQVWLGSYSDQHPFLGYKRTPYIALGALLCIGGALLTPHAALLMDRSFVPGLLLGVLAFGLWGMGFNVAVVAYLALASDLSGEQQRSQTVAIMWFMMIVAMIITGIRVGVALEVYSSAQLINVFNLIGLVAVILLGLGLLGLEPRSSRVPAHASVAVSRSAALRTVLANPQARIFFIYLVLLLASILGQDILLEPFGAQAFGMDVRQTTMLTPIWGGATLAALLLYGLLLSRFLTKKAGAMLGSALAAMGLFVIAASGLLDLQPLFLPGVALLGFGTGIAISTNLALMMDMTTPEQVGLFIGAWGVADAAARGAGTLLGGVGRDLLTLASGDKTFGYVGVFVIEGLFLCAALLLLRGINVRVFRDSRPGLVELVALAGDA